MSQKIRGVFDAIPNAGYDKTQRHRQKQGTWINTRDGVSAYYESDPATVFRNGRYVSINEYNQNRRKKR